MSKVLLIFNFCYFQTPQTGSQDTGTTAPIWEEKPAEQADNCCTKVFPRTSLHFQPGVWGIKVKKILRAQKNHKREKETSSIVATHLLTFHFTRNQYSPNSFCQKHKGTMVQGMQPTQRLFLSPHRGIKQTLFLCLPIYSEQYLSKKS